MTISWDLPNLEPVQLAQVGPVELPYVELALDPVSGDLAFPVRWIRGADAVVQRIRVRFKFFAGEWFLDQRLGIPFYQRVLIKNPDQLVITTIFRKVLLLTPGVAKVASFTADLDKVTRTLTTDFEASLADGTVIVAQAEPFILA